MQSRWWEYYFLRYFVGSVTGAVAVFALLTTPTSCFVRAGILSVKDFGSLGIQLTGIAALGFAYCYVASAPMLLLHAVRAKLRLDRSQALWAVLIIAPTLVGLVFVICQPTTTWLRSQWVAVLVLSAVVGAQIVLIVLAQVKGGQAIGEFYERLARARERGTKAETLSTATPSTTTSEKGGNDNWVGEYVESYRHLREHGNAFVILGLEAVLGFVLFSATRVRFAIVAVIVWLLPSVYSWFIGSFLEARLSQKQD